MSDVIGYIDHIAASTICGWAYDGSPNPTEVEISIDGKPIGKVRADIPRGDLAAAGIGTGRHSFECPIPRELVFSRGSIVTGRVNGIELLGSGRTVGSFLTDHSLLFNEDGVRVFSDRPPLLFLDEMSRLRTSPKTRDMLVSAMSDSIGDALGKVGNTFNVDILARFAASISSAAYASRWMLKAERLPNPQDQLGWALERAPTDGLYLEFGVFSGASINYIAERMPDKTIFGFDSFQGLPEDWDGIAPSGTFAMVRKPQVAKNVELVVGWFDKTLPEFIEQHPGERVAFLHIDCDLYSSTNTILQSLGPSICDGTIIVFDEYFNYPGWEQHEHRAFQQFVTDFGFAYQYIGLVPAQNQVCVRILNR